MKRSSPPLALLFLLALTLTACQPATTPPPAELESEDSTEADAGSTERTVVTVWMPDEALMMESDLPARFEEQIPSTMSNLSSFRGMAYTIRFWQPDRW